MTEPRIAWRRASRGLYFLGFGVLLLLTTLEVLGWGFWLEAASFWPVILVAVGVRMIFERSAVPWGVLLSPLIVFGTLGWVAATSPAGAFDGQWGPVRADAAAGTASWTFEARVGLAELDLRSAALPAGRLLEGRVLPGKKSHLQVREWRDATRVELSMFRRRRIGLLLPGRSRRWDLELARDLPMEMILQGAFTDGLVDLGTGRLSRLDLDGAFHSLDFRLPRPRESTRISIEGAFNRIQIMVPPDTPVSVRTEGAINLVDGRPDPPSSGAPGYRLSLQGFMNRVEILSDPDVPPQEPEEPREGEVGASGAAPSAAGGG